MPYAKIVGTGSYLPATLLTNADLEKMVDTTDEWILQRVGVRIRHRVEGTSDNTATMAEAAARRAIEAAGIDPELIDLIIVGTATAIHYFPSTACIIQGRLGFRRNVPAFDLNAACAGFLYALSVADQYIRTGAARAAVVVGVDALTRLVDFTDRSTCVLFGDGAGAVVLQATEEAGILNTTLHADGTHSDLIWADSPAWHAKVDPYLHMKGNEVFKIAVTKLGEVVEETLAANGLSQSDIDWLVPHQANWRIIAAMAKRLELPLERVILTVEEQGNTSAASIPLALDTAVRAGRIQRGDLLLFEAFGAGLAWGSALVRY